jgi:hypothetical protein
MRWRNVPRGAAGRLVQHGQRIGGEYLPVTPRPGWPGAQGLGRVLGSERLEALLDTLAARA